MVIADRHPLLLDGLEHALRGSDGFTVVARCDRGDDVLTAIDVHAPDIVVMDPAVPGMQGLAVLAELQRRSAPTRMIFLTDSISQRDVQDAVRLGIWGIVLKELSTRLVLQCLQKVRRGGRWVENQAIHAALAAAIGRDTAPVGIDRLTRRELDTVRMVAQGMRNKAIARSLQISEVTVKTHVRNVYRKLGVNSRVAVRCYAETRHIV